MPNGLYLNLRFDAHLARVVWEANSASNYLILYRVEFKFISPCGGQAGHDRNGMERGMMEKGRKGRRRIGE